MKFQSGRWLFPMREEETPTRGAECQRMDSMQREFYRGSRRVSKQCWHYTTGQCAAMIIESKSYAS